MDRACVALVPLFFCLFLCGTGPRRSHAKKAPLLQTYTAAPLNKRVRRCVVSEGPVCRSWRYRDQSAAWKQAMKDAGAVLAARKVRAVVFVHGTFAGDDPMGILRLVERVLLRQSLGKKSAWRARVKRLSDRMFRDGGNFLPAYRSLFCDGLGHRIQCRLFSWSSMNHHAGRLHGSFRLTLWLAKLRRSLGLKRDEKIVLVGHSHAGQLFALLSQFLRGTSASRELASIGFSSPRRAPTSAPSGVAARTNGSARRPASLPAKKRSGSWNRRRWELALREVKKLKIEMVTLGTPPRFRFARSPGVEVLHVINHRGSGVLGGRKRGAFFAAAGDYVQQWGIAGSDGLAMSSDWRAQNRRLQKLLGPGMNLGYLTRAIRHRMRVPNQGATLLVDYKDNRRRFLPSLRSVFGHAVYTRRRWMVWTARLLAFRWDVTRELWRLRRGKRGRVPSRLQD